MLQRAVWLVMIGVAVAACRPVPGEPELSADELDRLAASEDGDPARRAHATDHRREATALRDEEARACAGLAPEARDVSPLDDPSLQGVTDVSELERYGRQLFWSLRGAEIEVRAERGMTRAWLNRVLLCHLARHRTTILSDGGTDPLAVGRPVVSVVESETGFRISIRGRNEGEAIEIGRRARARLVTACTP